MSRFDHIFVQKDLAIADGTVPVSNSFVPSAEHLKLINKYALDSVEAEQVIALPIRAMNDQLDRDFDKFTEVCIDKLARNKGKTGPLGKPFMCSHIHGELANGRIYLAEKETIGKVNHLKLWVYVPNTPQYRDFVENIMFGVYWAVSVGVGVDKTSCTVCGVEWPRDYLGECDNGHIKGEKYEGTLCYRDIGLVSELYELSSVYLGAQYGAEVVKKMVTAKEGKPVEIIKEAIKEVNAKDEVPAIDEDIKTKETTVVIDVDWPTLSQMTLKVALDKSVVSVEYLDALEKKYKEYGKDVPWNRPKITALIKEGAFVEVDDEGIWTIDKNGKVWTYDGKRVLRQEVKKVEKKIEELTSELKDAKTERDAFEALVNESKTKLTEAKDLNKTIVSELEGAKVELEAKSKVVDSYLEGLKGEVIKWYKLSKGGSEEKEVDATFVTKLLEKCGDDPELMKELEIDFKERAKTVMPPEVLRSSMEDGTGIEDKKVKVESGDGIADSIHG